MVDRIFEPLFTTKQHGTGLGLAISHQIVTKHEGLMFAESNVGAGTSIHVFLPMVGARSTPTSPPTAQ
jgi:signal transduction histidine kinase